MKSLEKATAEMCVYEDNRGLDPTALWVSDCDETRQCHTILERRAVWQESSMRGSRCVNSIPHIGIESE